MDPHVTLAAFRGGFGEEALDARRVAGLLDAPGCVRRQVIDAASIPIGKLASLLGCPPGGQSPFAIARAHQFERLVTADAMGPLIRLVRERLGVSVTAVREKDLSADQVRTQFVRGDPAFRAELSQHFVREMLEEHESAINILRNPVLSLPVGSQEVYVEPDVVIFVSGATLKPLEIRSYSCIDGVADPSKVGATAREVAVHVLAIRAAATRLGHDPHRIDTLGLLVLPKNFSLIATAERIDVAPQVRRLQRMLAQFPDLRALAAHIPDHAYLPQPPGRHAAARERQDAAEQAADAIGALPPRFGDGCVGCALFAFCRTGQEAIGTVARLGTAAANLCGGVGTVAQAWQLALRQRSPVDAPEQALANDLARAAAASAWAERLSA